jgi:hypothetical protein
MLHQKFLCRLYELGPSLCGDISRLDQRKLHLWWRGSRPMQATSIRSGCGVRLRAQAAYNERNVLIDGCYVQLKVALGIPVVTWAASTARSPCRMRGRTERAAAPRDANRRAMAVSHDRHRPAASRLAKQRTPVVIKHTRPFARYMDYVCEYCRISWPCEDLTFVSTRMPNQVRTMENLVWL